MSNVIRLGDYITEISEKTTVNNQHMVLTSSQEGIVSQDDYFNKQVASKDNTGYKIIRRGQFTYRAMSDTGRFYINRLTDYDIGIVSPAYPVFELRTNGQILPEYLQEYFHSEHFQNAITLSSTGSTRVSLKLAKIADLRIDIPTLPKQQCAVQAISHVNHLISMQNSSAAKLDQLVKSQFVEMFGDPVSNAMAWQMRPFKETCILMTGNTPSRAVKEYYGSYIEWIKSDNITNSSLYLTTAAESLSEKGAEVGRVVHPGAILMTCIAGSLNTIGNVAIVDRDVAFNQQINAIIPHQYDTLFLCYLLKLLKPKLHEVASSALKCILNKGNLEAFAAIVPDIALQKEFSSFVVQSDKSKLAVKQSLEKLETLKKSLMQQYFG